MRDAISRLRLERRFALLFVLLYAFLSLMLNVGASLSSDARPESTRPATTEEGP